MQRSIFDAAAAGVTSSTYLQGFITDIWLGVKESVGHSVLPLVDAVGLKFEGLN